MSTVMILGASGFLGRAIAYALWKSHHRIYCLYRSVPAPFPWHWRRYAFPQDNLSATVRDYNPDIVIISATIARTSPTDSSPQNAAEFEQAFSTLVQHIGNRRIILTSTDAVFDGSKGQYTETDNTNPLTDYGRKSVIAENIIQRYAHDFLLVRTSYLSGYSLGTLNRRWQRLTTEFSCGRPLLFSRNVFKSPIDVETVAQYIAAAAPTSIQGIVHLSAPRLSVYDYHRQGMEHLQLTAYEHLLCIENAPHPIDTSLSTLGLLSATMIA